ncbi:hypothetical protein HU200_012880 [Digitaria exilis]|uniref:Uncharacterized protein n=1 Tax=Digitaria exilis TaxID=1010633 RepID=A0A835FDI4_9POAL|nr:hypothetical protein HU200_012880 [Digitaria exilis]
MEVQPSPIGDAFVRFGSPVERERFLDQIIQFGHGYTLRFIKNNEGLHVREHMLDREVWLMLMLFPNDARNNSALAKWYDSTNNARVVCKVHLHDDARIPDDVVVSAGIHPRFRSWTCPVFVLKRKDAENLGGEDAFPPNDGGIAHPFPPPVPRWMGMDGPNPIHAAVSDQQAPSHSAHGPSGNDGQYVVGDEVVGEVTMVDHDGSVETPIADLGDAGDAATNSLNVVVDNAGDVVSSDVEGTDVAQVSVTRAVILRQTQAFKVPDIPPGFETLVAIKVISKHLFNPGSSSLPSSSIFRNLKHLFISLDTCVHSYVCDTDVRRYLACIAFDPSKQNERSPGFIGPLRLALPLVSYPVSDDEDSEVQEIPMIPGSVTPRKRRPRKLKEPLDESFLRRSKRNNKAHGFRTDSLALEASNNPSIYEA